MDLPRKSHAIELILFLCRYYTRYDLWLQVQQLEAATINHLHDPVAVSMFGYSATHIYEHTVQYWYIVS